VLLFLVLRVDHDIDHVVVFFSDHEPTAFAEAIRCATKLKTAIDDMNMARL